MRATYDAARESDEYKNYWANVDYGDADAGHNKAVRAKLVARSRYEVQSNGYADGIAQTWTTDLVGVGPKLRMLSGSTGFNQLVELQFGLWMQAIGLRRKLWTMAHAKHQDGEAFGVVRTNRRVKHPVLLDLMLYETEQCQSPMVSFTDTNYTDGIHFDEFGNPEFYEILRRHPGATGYMAGYDLAPEHVAARFVMHWFKQRRPGQHRGVPDTSSTLNVGASAKRWREATLAAAETAADFAVLLKSNLPPDEAEDRDEVTPMDSIPVEKRMMVALPNSVEAQQLKAEHPTTTYESFNSQLVREQARPKNMPYNKAACDSSKYNYASGRLDHSTYYGALDVEREDVNDLVLDPLFDLWFDEAIRVFRWLGGNPSVVTPLARAHQWDWPAHQVADINAEANATDKKLRNGTLSLSAAYSEAGLDFEDELAKQAADFGLTVDEMRKVLLRQLYQVGVAALEPPKPETPEPSPADETSDETTDDTDDEESAESEDETTEDEEETADAAA